jgi:hypothetical protein
MARAAWYPKADKLDQGTTGGTMVGGMPHGTMHTTETRSWAGKPYYHIEFMEVRPGEVQCRQYRPFNMASRALRNLSGGVQTNRQGTVHINATIVGYSKDAPHGGAFTPAMYQALHEFAVWCEQEWGIPRTVSLPRPPGGPEFAGYSSPSRFTASAWRAYRGWSAHQNAPENTHWDAGKFDFDLMMNGGATVPGDDDMFCAKGDKGDKVEYWQRRILRINAGALPRYGADADFGGETQDAVAALVPGSDGSRIGPKEAEHLDALIAGGTPDLSKLATAAWVRTNFVGKGVKQLDLA